jgi:hypothetical protein
MLFLCCDSRFVVERRVEVAVKLDGGNSHVLKQFSSHRSVCLQGARMKRHRY